MAWTIDSIAVDGSHEVVTKVGFAAQQSAHYTRLTDGFGLPGERQRRRTYVQVTVAADSTADNQSLADLAADYQYAAFAAADRSIT